MNIYTVQTKLKKKFEDRVEHLVATTTITCKNLEELENTLRNTTVYLEHSVVSSTDSSIQDKQFKIKL